MDPAALHIHNVDLHFHAGQERQQGQSVLDYVRHAQMTGRRILGLTDHLGFFWPARSPREGMPYTQSLDGLCQYAQDVRQAQEAFPEMLLFFGPELSPRHAMEELPDAIVDIADYLICECALAGRSLKDDTESLVNRLQEAQRFVQETGVPAFIAHPLRGGVIHRVKRRQIEPWVTELEPRPNLDFSLDELSRFFALDLAEVGRVCRQTGIPLDINGGTQERMLSANLPAALQMLWAAWAALRDQGATFVPGSDQHHIVKGEAWRTGQPVPWDCFQALGLTAGDITFLHDLMG